MAASPVIDFTDLAEVRDWESLFGHPKWKKFMAIQQAKIDEIKEHAWVTFRTPDGAARGVAQIEVLTSVTAFEDEFRDILSGPRDE